MEKIIHSRIEDVPRKYKNQHKDYEHYKRALVPMGSAKQCAVSVYEVPPGKSAVPYHYHIMNEELFYIISGQGILKTPSGNRPVKAGEFIFFPANENGAHKLTNSSETELLIYLDFDTSNELEAVFYPDSGKIGIWGKEINQLYKTSESVDYYEGE